MRGYSARITRLTTIVRNTESASETTRQPGEQPYTRTPPTCLGRPGKKDTVAGIPTETAGKRRFA